VAGINVLDDRSSNVAGVTVVEVNSFVENHLDTYIGADVDGAIQGYLK
jgi:hypothetical protein